MELPLNKTEPLVMHIDINSCFATICQQAFPHLRGKVVVIAAYTTPKGCILSPSIEAKRYGIKTGMTIRDARLLYPHLIARTPDTALIRDVHMKFRTLLQEYSPDVIPKSIDEAVLHFDSQQTYQKKPLLEIGREIKQRIRREIGEWISCSVGIGTNRFWAKTAASLTKPDGLELISHKNIHSVFSRLALTDLHGINVGYERRLNACGIITPLQFLAAPASLLQIGVFQSIHGIAWYKRLRGYETDRHEFGRKSFGQEYSLGKKTSDPDDLSRICMKLCEKMGRRLRRHGLSARGIHVGLLYEDHSRWHKGQMMRRRMHATSELFEAAQHLFSQQPQHKIVKKMGVSCYELSPECQEDQLNLFDNAQDEQKTKKISRALDAINDRFGEYTITPAIMLKKEDIVPDLIAFGGVREIESQFVS